MLAAGHQAQSEARLIERDVRRDEQQERNEHEPAELKPADIHEEELLRRAVLDDRGDVIGVGGDIDRLDDDGRGRETQHVQRRTDDGLVSLEVDAGHGQQRRIDHAEEHRDQHHREDHHDSGHRGREVAHHQRAAERAHNHDALQTEVDDAGVFREAAAEGDENQHGGEGQRILHQKQHYFSPPFSVCAAAALAAAFSSRRAMPRFMAYFMNSTKPHR